MKILLLVTLFPFFLISQTQIGEDIDGISAGDRSGYVSISNDGTILAIGGPGNNTTGADAGHVRVFENISGVWTQIDAIYGNTASDNFGESVSISGDGTILAIGAPNNDEAGTNAGHVTVYQNISGTWTKLGETITGDSADDNFGMAVSLSDYGTILSISSIDNTRVYENISGAWTQLGSDINNIISSSIKSSSILSGDGSVVATSELYYYGWWGYASYDVIYENISGTWTQIGDSLNSFGSGSSLSSDGSIIALTSTYGFASVYENIGDVWTQIGDNFSIEGSVIESSSLSSDGAIIGIGGNNGGNEFVSIFRNINSDWTQIGTTINGVNTDDNFGSSLSISADGSAVAIGANGYDGNGIDSGNVRVYDLAALLSVEESKMLNARLFPNPATNQFTIRPPDGQTLEKVNIYNNLGQFIQTSETRIIKTSHLASGLYYVEVITNSGKATQKLLINK